MFSSHFKFISRFLKCPPRTRQDFPQLPNYFNPLHAHRSHKTTCNANFHGTTAFHHTSIKTLLWLFYLPALYLFLSLLFFALGDIFVWIFHTFSRCLARTFGRVVLKCEMMMFIVAIFVMIIHLGGDWK